VEHVRHFVFSSTAAVYGPSGLSPVSEELFVSPGVSHVLNCGYGCGHSVLEVLDMMAHDAGRPIPHVFDPRRPGDLDRVVADNRRLKERLSWRLRYDDLRAIVTDALRWERYLSRHTPDITG
jgi:UDP-glucose 4-epimerase